MEDTSELGEDDDDIGEVMEHVDDEHRRKAVAEAAAPVTVGARFSLPPCAKVIYFLATSLPRWRKGSGP